MDFIIADMNRQETGILPADVQIDIDLSQNADNKPGHNDIELRAPMAFPGIGYGGYIFSPGTEYGGRILDLKRSTSSVTAVWYLDTWRRMLGQAIIEPPEGEAYLTVSGDANTVLSTLLEERFGGIFVVPEYLAGIMLSGQFDRYTTLLDGVNKMLAANNARLKIQSVQGGSGEPFSVSVEAVPVMDYSAEIEYSQDNKVDLIIRDFRRGINHLICLGTGELLERMVRHYTGLDERTAVFDYPNAEDEAELLESGRERLLELANYKKLEMEVQDLDLDIGDIVAGRDRMTGTCLSKPIINKIFRVRDGKETITYKVKGEN